MCVQVTDIMCGVCLGPEFYMVEMVIEDGSAWKAVIVIVWPGGSANFML